MTYSEVLGALENVSAVGSLADAKSISMKGS